MRMNPASIPQLPLALLLLVVALSAPGARSAEQAVVAPAWVVVLEFPDGQKLTAVPDATGKFVFEKVPVGTGTLKVVAAPQKTAGVQAVAGSVKEEIAPPVKEGTVEAREAGSGMATGKRQHKPMVFKVTLDGAPEAAKTQSMDDWHMKPISVVVGAKSKSKELTGHVTLIK